MLVCLGVELLEWLRIDDPIGAVPVHGFCGIWGTWSLGLFACGKYGATGPIAPDNSAPLAGLFYGGGMNQFWAELIGVTTCFVTLSLLSLFVYFVAEKLVGNRVSKEVEIQGLDLPEMGAPGYSGMVMDHKVETPVT